MTLNDMTKGNAVKQILYFAVPLFIGNIFQQIYNIVDTMVAGYTLGDGAIAAIGATSILYGLLVNFAWGMNSGFSIVLSRSFGAKEEDNVKRSIAAMIVLDSVIALLLSTGSLILLNPMLKAMNLPASIYNDAYAYIFVIFAGMAAAIAYNMFTAILRAVGNSRTPLLFLIFSSILNLLLDVLFVVVMKLGVRGAALATVISETVSAILCAVLVIKQYSSILPSRKHFVFDKGFLSEMVLTGGAMAFMVCIVDLGSVFYQRAINNLGDYVIVAHTAARKIMNIFILPISSLASANSTFISQNWGAKAYDRISYALRKVLLIEVLWGVFACGIAYLFGEQLIRLLTNTTDPAVIAYARLSIRIQFVFFPILGILLAFRTALQSMGRKIVPLVSSSFELVFKIFAGFVLIPSYGYLWVCLSEPVIWTVCVLLLLISQGMHKERFTELTME